MRPVHHTSFRHRSGSTDVGESPSQKPSNSTRTGLGWGNFIRRIEDSLVGDVIGAVSLIITVIGVVILGVGLS